mmetsp:Transcript_7888/g.19679  ORF Transcript_7888/g.19679 Transcript_7888/m.19679 type:complete len:588 (+) Transcript_7888:366-2129(+)|eukprot:CAMPEP_0113454080 /NCGR_PEP_ID=MMETSP0014_2-20120614/7682_1 /TAXON_ID=2857 /ORGANISM="Nitzschia sp." /LENGTH=587 /DNA_ID=CAMNT_0000345481 /DNA_START=141 /DNA_END=1904 /DNA_ORIENTATION=- /assembly_acc=CAM_ASM_000159
MSQRLSTSSRAIPKTKTSSSSDALRVVAKTAGSDSWKTWAGRSHGTNDDFEVSDLWRGLKLTLQHKLGFKGNPPPPGTACPVCLTDHEEEEEPDEADNNQRSMTSTSNKRRSRKVSKNDGGSNKWHVTYCGCAVCKDCMNGYVQSQIRDPEHSGVLKCPVCTKDLRSQDAVMALDGNEELISEWDTKIRNNLLRALPSYRPCPRCSNKNMNINGDSHSSGNDKNDPGSAEGGGFVTPECLAPHYQERLADATQVIQHRHLAPMVVLLSYFGFVWIILKTPSRSVHVDLFFMLAPLFIFLKLGVLCQLWVATQARSIFFRPIQVGCPCCNEEFILPADANSSMYEDERTNEWMKNNTRQCPSCSVPISKIDGCNHMNCSHCKAQFCWACMRLRTSCRAYRCNNQAPFGDAIPTFDDGDEGQNNNGDGRDRRVRRRPPRPNGSVLTIIDYLLDQPYPQISYKDGILLLVCIFARYIGPVRFVVHNMMSMFSSVLFTNTILGLVVVFILHIALTGFHEYQMINRTRRHVRRQRNAGGGREGGVLNPAPVQQQQQQRRQQGGGGGGMNDGLLRQLEQDIIAEALRRSVEDQ